MSSDKENIRSWWAENPMTYGAVHGETSYEDGEFAMGTKEFFERLDREFYSWNRPLHNERPFDKIFPYDSYTGKNVLEVGCGLGTMISNWARNGANAHAVDLNPVSVAQTTKRFETFGLSGDIRQADAQAIPFPDEHFDYAYSWGVLHHSPDLERSLAEFFRTLKGGGEFGIMLYNRNSFLYRYLVEYVEGFLHYEDRFLTPLELASRYGDAAREEGNPHTWPVTKREIRSMLRPLAQELKFKTFGVDLDYNLLFLLPGLGMLLPTFVKKTWARRFGWSLWIYGTKR